jgi:hypothetical protein
MLAVARGRRKCSTPQLAAVAGLQIEKKGSSTKRGNAFTLGVSDDCQKNLAKPMCRQKPASAARCERKFALSCPPNRAVGCRLFRHRRFSEPTFKCTIVFSATRCSTSNESSGTPCTPPRSSTGCLCCVPAAVEPSRRIFPLDLRGIITGTRAWFHCVMTRMATGKISCFPSSLVCTSSHPPKRSSMFKF